MPKLLFSICSELASIDAISNNISIFNILEDLQSPKFPITFPRIFITSLWQRKKDEAGMKFEALIKFVNPDDKKIREWKGNWTFNKLRHRHISIGSNLKFDKPGMYKFRIYIRKKDDEKWKKQIHEIPLIVQKTNPVDMKKN